MKKTLHLITACMLSLALTSCGGGGGGSSSNSGSTASSCSAGSSAGTGSSSVTQLTYVDNVVGTGPAAADGDKLTVNYTGYLYNSADTNNEGTNFTNGTASYTFQLGAGQVIPGWDQGLVGMQVGGTRTLTIPSSLAYGSCPSPSSPIPPDSALVFVVQLTSI
jgi:FKBP-type peptidyl-prolyl cis-trans isomerase FkpA